jgi:hypothetical protein
MHGPGKTRPDLGESLLRGQATGTGSKRGASNLSAPAVLLRESSEGRPDAAKVPPAPCQQVSFGPYFHPISY